MSTKRKISMRCALPERYFILTRRSKSLNQKNPEKFCSEVQSWQTQWTTQQGGFGQRRNLPPNLFARSADRTVLVDEAFVPESERVRRERHFCRFAA
jgi:hypothetical protein